MADYIFRRNFEYSGWADGNYLSTGRWLSQGGHWDTREEFYDTSRQFWCVNMSQLAKDYPGYIVESLLLQTWCRKKKHSNEHTVQLVDYRPTNGIKERPSMYPHFDVYSAPLAAPVQKVWPGKNNNLTWDTVHRLYKPYPIEELLERPVVISYTGVPNSRREYGWCKVIGVQAYKEQKAFPGWTSEVMGDNGFIVPGEANQLLGPGHWLSEYTGGREYLGFNNNQVTLGGWVQTYTEADADSYIPGQLFAGTTGYLVANPTPRKRIKAVKVGMIAYSLAKDPNPMYISASASRTGGYPSATERRVPSNKNAQVTDWLPVTVERGGSIFIWLRVTRYNKVSWKIREMVIKDIQYY